MTEYDRLLKENNALKDKLNKMETLLKDNLFTKCICCENYFSGFESIPMILGCMDIKSSMLDINTDGIKCFTNDINHIISNPWCIDCIPDNSISKRIENLDSMIVMNIIYNFDENGSPTPLTRQCFPGSKLEYRLYLPNISHEEMLNDLKKVDIKWCESIGLNDFYSITKNWGIKNHEPLRSELIESSYIVNSSKINDILSYEEKILRVKNWLEMN